MKKQITLLLALLLLTTISAFAGSEREGGSDGSGGNLHYSTLEQVQAAAEAQRYLLRDMLHRSRGMKDFQPLKELQGKDLAEDLSRIAKLKFKVQKGQCRQRVRGQPPHTDACMKKDGTMVFDYDAFKRFTHTELLRQLSLMAIHEYAHYLGFDEAYAQQFQFKLEYPDQAEAHELEYSAIILLQNKEFARAIEVMQLVQRRVQNTLLNLMPHHNQPVDSWCDHVAAIRDFSGRAMPRIAGVLPSQHWVRMPTSNEHKSLREVADGIVRYGDATKDQLERVYAWASPECTGQICFGGISNYGQSALKKFLPKYLESPPADNIGGAIACTVKADGSDAQEAFLLRKQDELFPIKALPGFSIRLGYVGGWGYPNVRIIGSKDQAEATTSLEPILNLDSDGYGSQELDGHLIPTISDPLEAKFAVLIGTPPGGTVDLTQGFLAAKPVRGATFSLSCKLVP